MINFENYAIRPLEVADLVNYFDLVDRNRKRLEDFFVGTVSNTKDIAATRVFLSELIEKRESKQYFPFIFNALQRKFTFHFVQDLPIPIFPKPMAQF